MLTFANYQHYRSLFAVDDNLLRRSIAACEPLVIEALSVFAQPHLWRGELPVYGVLTTPQENGGWGHLMPLWFKPQDRPAPIYALNNWALFALVYAHSFGASATARRLVQQVFTLENIVRIVVGTNLQLPFLPTTQGHGSFFRQGMLPFLLSILWLTEESRRAWLHLHELGAQHFIASHNLAACADPVAVLTGLEYAIFSRLERNTVTSDEAVAAFLAPPANSIHGDAPTGTPSLLALYQAMFGAINLGVTALAAYYQHKPLEAWRDWILQEIIIPYRMPDYGVEAIKALVKRDA
ncbi:MAG: hypothetical protein AB1801_04830 [Chloroflexota bacterium]